MPHIEENIVINRPIDEVWAYLTDFFNAPRMSGAGIIGLRQVSPGALGVGSTLRGRRVILGFEVQNTFLVTEWDPPHAFTGTTIGRPFRSSSTRLTLESSADGTHFHHLTDFELQPAMKLVWLLYGPIVRKRMHASLAHTKALIEARPQ